MSFLLFNSLIFPLAKWFPALQSERKFTYFFNEGEERDYKYFLLLIVTKVDFSMIIFNIDFAKHL